MGTKGTLAVTAEKDVFLIKERALKDTRIGWVERRIGQPRCHGEIALADAVITLVSNLAARQRRRIEFRPEWFNVESNAAPESA